MDTKKYYSIYDRVANDYMELWSSKNNASALRTFHQSLAVQLKSGTITSEDDYQLFHVVDLVVDEEGGVVVKEVCEEVIDNEVNNKEQE